MMGWLWIVLVGMVTGEWEPVRADLSTSRWFPPITKQLDESCAQQAGIYYLLSYELNRARNQSASEARYRYPAHFPWQFVNEGRDRGSELVDGWLIAKEMGIPSEKIYGGPRALGEWMHGYNRYLEAMRNRVLDYVFEPLTDEEELRKAKHWLGMGEGRTGESGRLLVFDARLEGNRSVEIPEGHPEAGKSLILTWGATGRSHVMTYVGFDDAVGYDLNGDGEITNDRDITADGVVDLADWERGAFKLANSHGAEWMDDGFAYVLYRESAVTRLNRGKWVARIEVDAFYQPRFCLRLSLAAGNRSEVRVRMRAVADGGEIAEWEPLIFAEKPGEGLVLRWPDGPEKYSAFHLGKRPIGHQPLSGPGPGGTVEMGFDLTGRLPGDADRYELTCSLAGESWMLIEDAALHRYDEKGQILGVQEFSPESTRLEGETRSQTWILP